MADRSAAEAFHCIFEELAKPKYPNHLVKEIAQAIAKATEEFDFTADEMYCDEALIALGLEHMIVDRSA